MEDDRDRKKVSLFYKLGAKGEWVMAEDNIDNTGTFTWTVTNEVSNKVRFLVSDAPWVIPDISDGDNSMIASIGVFVRGQRQAKHEKGQQGKSKVNKNGKGEKAHDLNGCRLFPSFP